MSIENSYPQYTAIAHHIRAARIERVVPIAEAIADFLVDSWRAIQAPPRPAAIIINDRFPGAGLRRTVSARG